MRVMISDKEREKMEWHQQAFDPAAHNDYAPNAVQLEFLRLVSARYEHVGLGDSNHTRPSVMAFAVNAQTLRAFAETGKSNFFLEQPRTLQPKLDALRNGASVDVLLNGQNQMHHSWLLSAPPRERLCGVFVRAAAANPEIRFVAADTRLEGFNKQRLKLAHKYDSIKSALINAIGITALFLPYSLSRRILTRIFSNIANNPKSAFMAVLADDRSTAAFINSQKKPGVTLFGAMHWRNYNGNDKSSRSLRKLVAGGDAQKLCVIDICDDIIECDSNDASTRKLKHFDNSTALGPDAALIVHTGSNDNYGVIIKNEALRPLYEQAVAAAAAKVTPEQIRSMQVVIPKEFKRLTIFG